MTTETRLERIRRAILRVFPSWFRWLLSALVLTTTTILLWDFVNAVGFRTGEWVTVSYFGPHFNGGQDVLFFIGGAIGAVYCWIRVALMLRAAACKHATDRKQK